MIKKSIKIEFQQMYQFFWKILTLENLLAVLDNVNTVPETKRIVNCSNLSKAQCTSKEWQSNCGHGVLPSSSSKCLHHLHSPLVVKVPEPVYISTLVKGISTNSKEFHYNFSSAIVLCLIVSLPSSMAKCF